MASGALWHTQCENNKCGAKPRPRFFPEVPEVPEVLPDRHSMTRNAASKGKNALTKGENAPKPKACKKAPTVGKAPTQILWRQDAPKEDVERSKEAMHNWWRDSQRDGKPPPSIEVRPCAPMQSPASSACAPQPSRKAARSRDAGANARGSANRKCLIPCNA